MSPSDSLPAPPNSVDERSKDRGVTVVVPTFNRGTFVIQSVKDLLRQDHSPLEILIVDQSTEPSTLPDLAAAHSDVISYQHVPFRGVTRARNFGWRNSRYELIVYIDDDIRCDPDFVRRHASALEAEPATIIAGGVDEAGMDTPEPVGFFNRANAEVTRGWNSHTRQYVHHAPGGNFSMTRSLLEAVGGFDTRFEAGSALYEETEFCLEARRLGYQVLFAPEVRLTHLMAPRGGNRVRNEKAFTYGLAHNRAVVIRRHVQMRYWLGAMIELASVVWRRRRASGSWLELLEGARGALVGFVEGGMSRKTEP